MHMTRHLITLEASGQTFPCEAGDTVLRAGYSIAYNRNGMGSFTGVFSGNPGRQITTNRTSALGNLVLDGGSLPVLLRETNRLGPPALPRPSPREPRSSPDPPSPMRWP